MLMISVIAMTVSFMVITSGMTKTVRYSAVSPTCLLKTLDMDMIMEEKKKIPFLLQTLFHADVTGSTEQIPKLSVRNSV